MSRLVYCANCTASWDETRDAHRYERVCNRPYCKGKCLLAAWESVYRKRAGYELRSRLEGAREKLNLYATHWNFVGEGFGSVAWLNSQVEKLERFERGEEVDS